MSKQKEALLQLNQPLWKFNYNIYLSFSQTGKRVFLPISFFCLGRIPIIIEEQIGQPIPIRYGNFKHRSHCGHLVDKILKFDKNFSEEKNHLGSESCIEVTLIFVFFCLCRNTKI